MQPVKLTLMTDGYCEQLERIAIQGGRFVRIRFASMFALIEHPRVGPILFDTGYTKRFFDETARWPAMLYRMVTPVHLQEGADVASQLKSRSIKPDDIKHVIISHFHADHIGGLKDFPNATFHCTREAYATSDTYKGLNAVRHAFLPGLLPKDFKERVRFVESCTEVTLPRRFSPFTKARDILDDGSILSVDLPGHAVGQLGVFLTDATRGDYLLAADACWLSQSFRHNLMPHPIVRMLIDWGSFRSTLNRLPPTAYRKSNGLDHTNSLFRNLERPSMSALSILWHYAQAKRNLTRWTDRSELEQWQDRQVKRHLKAILPRSPFYQRLYAGRSVEDWREFPTISKVEMMKHFNELNTVGLDRDRAFELALEAERSRNFVPTIGNVTIGLSSGTSGNRGLFIVQPKETFAWAGNMLAKILPGSLLDRHRAALFLRANSNLYGSVATGRFSFAFFDLLEPMSTLIHRLQEFSPTLLVAPPSVLRRLAEAQRDGKINLRPIRIFSVAEVLEPEDKAFIEEWFQVPVFQIYQATEGFLGVSCVHGTLHLNEDIVVIQKEWLDEKRRKFSPVITDFRRRTQPILRYRLNDILTERAIPCPCGSVFTAIESIEGRCDDMFLFRVEGTQKTIEVFPDFIRRAIITSSPAITEYRAIQDINGDIEIQLAVDFSQQSCTEIRVRENFQQLCTTLGCVIPKISFAPIANSEMQTKLRRVLRRKP